MMVTDSDFEEAECWFGCDPRRNSPILALILQTITTLLCRSGVGFQSCIDLIAHTASIQYRQIFFFFCRVML